MSRLTDEIRTYLENLRESGDVNMMGAAPYLQAEFGLTKQQAKDALLQWMRE